MSKSTAETFSCFSFNDQHVTDVLLHVSLLPFYIEYVNNPYDIFIASKNETT